MFTPGSNFNFCTAPGKNLCIVPPSLWSESAPRGNTDVFRVLLKLVWRLSGVFIGENLVNQITRQSSYWFCHKISIKSITQHTVSILYLDYFYMYRDEILLRKKMKMKILVRKKTSFRFWIKVQRPLRSKFEIKSQSSGYHLFIQHQNIHTSDLVSLLCCTNNKDMLVSGSRSQWKSKRHFTFELVKKLIVIFWRYLEQLRKSKLPKVSKRCLVCLRGSLGEGEIC